MTSDPLAPVRTVAAAVAAAKANANDVPAARAAIDAALDAECPAFPSACLPATADDLAQYTAVIARPAPARFAATMADTHERCLGVNEGLARLLRSRECLEDVGQAATVNAVPMNRESIGEAYARASANAQRNYKRIVAAQLVARSDHELCGAAKRLLEVFAVEDELVAAIAAHEANARSEKAREQREQREAARAKVAELVEQVRDAAAKAGAAGAAAESSAAEYRRIRRAALCERIQLAGVSDVRTGGRALYSARDLLAVGCDFDDGTIASLERAIDAIDHSGQDVEPESDELTLEAVAS